VDIYCEKPLAYDVREGRAMVEAWRKANNIVQIGFQRRQSDAIAAAGKYVRDGNAGEIVMVDANIHYSAGRKSREPTPPPETLDCDFWCGPAPKLPHSEAVGHFHWRLEKEYGHGHLVDWGIHVIDGVRTILGETMPKRITAAGGLYELKDYITTPDTLTVQVDFDTCPVVWRHRIWGAAEYRPEVSNGMFFYGTKETVFATDDRWMIIPKGKDAEPKVTEIKTTDKLQGRHWEDFLRAVQTREPARVTPQDGHCSTSTVQLGMIAYETGSPIAWNPQKEEIVDNPDAAKLLKRDYRAPWEHPAG
jgi:predicted dehydrogenase